MWSRNLHPLVRTLAGAPWSDLRNMRVTKTLERSLGPHSKIDVESPMSVRMVPSDSDRLTVDVYGEDSTLDHDTDRIRVDGAGALCVVRAPYGANVRVRVRGDSSISVEGTHTGECELESEAGDVTLRDAKGRTLGVTTEGGGDVRLEGTVTAGEIRVRVGSDADVDMHHLRVDRLEVTTDAGYVRTRSCYCGTSRFTTLSGSPRLENVHGECAVEVLERGDLTLTGFAGALRAELKRGNVHLQASRLCGESAIFVHEAGTVRLALADVRDQMRSVELIAERLTVRPDLLAAGETSGDRRHRKFAYENEAHPERNTLRVECRNGAVTLEAGSWKDSLTLKGIRFERP